MYLEPLPRRKFLKLGLITGTVAVTALDGYTIAAQMLVGSHQASSTKYLVLNKDQVRVLTAFAEAIVPTGEKYPTVQQAEVVQRLDEELFFVSRFILDELAIALNALQWMPIFYGYFSRFSRLSQQQRLAFLNETKDTGSDIVRAVINNCRMVCFNFYYGHESTWDAIGYDGPFAKIPQIHGEQRRYYREKTQKGSERG